MIIIVKTQSLFNVLLISCACVRACVRACMRVCVRACVCACNIFRSVLQYNN